MNIRDELIELGKRVKMIRKEMHISQKDFAGRINISGSFLSEIEAGKSKPGYDFIYHISKVCNVSLPYILHGVGDMFTDIDYRPFAKAMEPRDWTLHSVDQLLWILERSPLLEHTVLGFSAKFIYENIEFVKQEIEKFDKNRVKPDQEVK